MTEEFSICGEGLAFSFRGSSYQFPEITTGSDANWIRATTQLEVSHQGTFTGCQPIFLLTTELTDFLAELRELERTGTGEATLHHIEGQVMIAITLGAGGGEMRGKLREHQGAELRFDRVRTDQTYVRRALHGLEAFVRAFPVRDQPKC